MRADDALKYAAAQLRAQTDWALDSIGGSLCETHEDELDALHNAIAEVSELAEQLGDPNRARHRANRFSIRVHDLIGGAR